MPYVSNGPEQGSGKLDAQEEGRPVSSRDGLGIALVVIAAHDPDPWETCLTGLDLRPGPGFSQPGPAGGPHVRGRLFEHGLARVLLEERAVPGGQDSLTEVRFWVPEVMPARERAIAAGAQALSEPRRFVAPDDSGAFEEAALGGVGINHCLLAATGSVDRPMPAAGRDVSVGYLVLAVDGPDLGQAARFYIRAYGMELLCQGRIQAGGQAFRSILLAGGGWALAIAAQDPAGAPGLLSQFLAANDGPGIMHVAIRVPDILAAAGRADERDVELLPIPAEYYESVPDQLGYVPPNLAELKRRHIAVGLDLDGRVTYHATTGPVSQRSRVSFGLTQCPPAPPGLSHGAVSAVAAARVAADCRHGFAESK